MFSRETYFDGRRRRFQSNGVEIVEMIETKLKEELLREMTRVNEIELFFVLNERTIAIDRSHVDEMPENSQQIGIALLFDRLIDEGSRSSSI